MTLTLVTASEKKEKKRRKKKKPSASTFTLLPIFSLIGGLQAPMSRTSSQVHKFTTTRGVTRDKVRQVSRHHGSRILQFVRHGQENGVHVVGLFIILCRRLEERHVMRVSKLLSQVCVHSDALDHVTLVAHENAGNVLVQVVAVTLLDPCRHVLKRGHLGHVIHKDNGVNVPVVMLNHGFTEPLLASCVPQLQLKQSSRK